MSFSRITNESEINPYTRVVRDVTNWIHLVNSHCNIDDEVKVCKIDKLKSILEILQNYEIKEIV